MRKRYIVVCLIIFLSVIIPKSVQPIMIPINDGIYYDDIERTDNFEELCKLVEFHCCPLEYEIDVTDCSEMSAYWEWYLENKGYHVLFVWSTHIVGSNHMWLLVETDRGYIPIETAWGQHAAILEEPFYSENYFEGYTCDTIYELIKVFGISEVDWWNL